ncbi:hypothetical protein CBR_g41287 [Chara braunii]|uniref:Uncharacterized protein n=1 Tax=Chara braunii TaxID=69332 RepID=A0A388LVL9_CHABU|nr:hypothetical protein CBR_g41287 [Chara braunii]|eukprot:GBG86293.1 hypothetical protein CBR_g41287 [Chara braunii]
MRMLIAKCYEEGIIPGKFRHGEWVVEGGIRLFKVNQGLDTLVTAWLKERTVTVIFQGEARDLPLRTREDLVRAYENGWYRERIFDRSVKRGRIHGEGPNVLSYVAKSREVAQWMIAKGEDKVTIREVEYGMVFKPWLTKAELEERRRLEDDSKFWVVALRVPLRVMFHVESMVETAMGRVIKAIPPEPDKSRPKLMNLKFELVREAEERFEEDLSIKLDDGEIYYIKFACKNTPWCDTCRWYFHTATEGCPRQGEVQQEQQPNSGARENNLGTRRGGDGDGTLNRGIWAAAREVHPSAIGHSESSSSSQGNQSRPLVQQPQNTLNAAAAVIPQQQQGTWIQQHPAPIPLAGGTHPDVYQWQALYQALNQDPRLSNSLAGANPAISPPCGYPYSGGQFANPPGGYYGASPAGPSRPLAAYPGSSNVPIGQAGGMIGGTTLAVNGDGIKEIHQVQAQSSNGPHSGSQDLSGSGTLGASPGRVPGGIPSPEGGATGYEERWLLPLVCTLQAQAVHVIGLVNKEGKMTLPAQQIDGLATPELILRKVKELFADHFSFRICPDGLMPKLDLDLPGGKRIRYSIPLIAARFQDDQWPNISRVGLTSVHIQAFTDPSVVMLAQMVVDPGVPATILEDLKNTLPRWQNFSSTLFAESLSEQWPDNLATGSDARPADASNRIQPSGGLPGSNE